MVEKSISLNHSVGIKAAQSDFKIIEGIMKPGTSEISRFCKWLEMAIRTGSYERLQEVCDSWGSILRTEEDKFQLMSIALRSASHRIKWGNLSKAVVKKACTNETRTKAFLEIYFYCPDEYQGIEMVYELFVFNFTMSLCESLIKCSKDIIKIAQKQLLLLETPHDGWSYRLISTQVDTINTCKVCLNRLEYFLKSIAGFVKKHEDSCFRSDIIEILVVVTGDVRAILSRFKELA